MKELKKAQMGMIAILTVMLVSITRRLPTRKLSSGITTLALAGIVLLVAAGSVSALPACPAPGNMDISASCELNQSWPAVAAGEYGYKIMANGVVIDGKGYTLTGTMPATCGGGEAAPCTCAGVINYDFDNAVVKDLEITGFCTGVVMGDNAADDVVNMTVTGCKIHNCGESAGTTHGIHLVRANDCTISKNEIYEIDGTGIAAGCGGGGNGIFGYGADQSHGNYGSVTCNYLHDNTKSGVFTKKMCQYWTFSNNNASANLQGGIVPMCKKSSFCTIEYNIMTGNGAFGYQSQANQNTLRFNTITNNGNFGIQFDSDNTATPKYGMNNKVYNNTICGHTVADIRQNGLDGGTNKVDSNTCDSTYGTVPAGACDWSCDTQVPIYYDYDGDVHYSAASCSCGNILSVGACCNPGLFNDTGASTHCDGGVCVLSAGDDPNDCDPGAPAEQPYYCDVDEDGYFSASPTATGAEVPPDCQSEPGDDCDDTDAAINPGAAENCTDNIDNDCDGLVDGADPDCFPNKVYFEPSDIRVPEYCNNKTVSIWINSTDTLGSGTIIFDYASCCADVTSFVGNTTNFDPTATPPGMCAGTLTPGRVKIDFGTHLLNGLPANIPVHVGDMTIECNASDYSYCVTDLAWNTTDTEVILQNATDVEITPVNYEDGTFRCNIPDLVVTWVKGNEINETLYNVTCTVKNIGKADAIGVNATLMVDDPVVFETMPMGDIAPGNTSTKTFASEIEQTGTVDNLTVCADYDDTIVELDENNNCMNGRYPGEIVISIQPAVTYVQPQDQFDVKVYIDTKGIEVYAVQYRLTCNTSVVRAETQTKDTFLGGTYDTVVLVNEIDQPHGEASYAETRIDTSIGVTDNDNVTNIHFIAIGERNATTNLTLDEIILSDKDGVRIAYRIESGKVEITENTPPDPVGVSKHRTNNVAQKYQCISTLCSCSYDLDYPGKGGNISYIRWAFGDGQYGTSEGLPVDNCTCKEHRYESWQWAPIGNSSGAYVPFDVQLEVTDDGCPELTNNSTFTINVYIAGDANGDGEVNILDAVWVGKHWRETCSGDPQNPMPDCCGDCEGYLWGAETQTDGADLNNDCEINILDAVIVGANWRHTAW